MEQNSDRLQWLKIARLDTLGRILDVSDPSPQPKIFNPDEEGERAPKYALNYTEYDTNTNKAKVKHRHWVDETDLYLLAWDLMNRRPGEKGQEGRYLPLHQEFKGGNAKSAGVESLGDRGVVSRQFSVTYTDQLTKLGPAYEFRFLMVEGEAGQKGQITPKRGAPPFVDAKMYVQMSFARKFGAAIYRYLAAKPSAALVGSYYVDPLWARMSQK
jgi:hypothetical protein